MSTKRKQPDSATFSSSQNLASVADRLCGWCMDRDSNLWRSHVESQSFVIADMTEDDCPIKFASQGFLALTGYERDEIIGKNCRFLQGCAAHTYKIWTNRCPSKELLAVLHAMMLSAVCKSDGVDLTLTEIQSRASRNQ